MLSTTMRSALASRCALNRLPTISGPSKHMPVRLCRAAPEDAAASPSATRLRTPPAAGRPAMPRVLLGPDGQPLEVVPIEKAGDAAWAGVAGIDKGEQGMDAGSRIGLLVAGDAAMLVLFAVIGRVNHGEVLDVETLTTALPFVVGWFASAALLGGFGKEAQGSEVGPAALTAAKCWAVGTPLGLLLRGLQKGYMPPKPFIIVSLAATAVLLIGWRAALAAATPKEQAQSRAQQLAGRKNKTGGPFEFMQLLFGLVSRW